MKNLYYMTGKMFMALLFRQMRMQQELNESQQIIIALQKRIDELTPKVVPDNEVIWHVASKGMLSKEAALSDDPKTVRAFQDWLVGFAKKYIKPYVNPKVYMEASQQMTRGLPERLAELETKKAIAGKMTPVERQASIN